MNQYFVPHPALYGFVTGPEPQISTPKPPAPPSPYAQLKELDQQLDLGRANIAQTREAYQKTLQEFATLCHQLWQQERAPGSRDGKGFRRQLLDAGINAGRAYRAMKKFFPADFPVPAKPKKLTLSARNKVANPVPSLRFRAGERGEVLECVFALTPGEKAEFQECLKVVDASQVKKLMLEAMKQAAEAIRTGPALQKKAQQKQGKTSHHPAQVQQPFRPKRECEPASPTNARLTATSRGSP
jgi:hypothetical protein